MKTEKEIRAFTNDLEKLLKEPCADGKSLAQRSGEDGKLYEAVRAAIVQIATLRWVLGEVNIDSVIESTAKLAREL